MVISYPLKVVLVKEKRNIPACAACEGPRGDEIFYPRILHVSFFFFTSKKGGGRLSPLIFSFFVRLKAGPR